MEAFRNTDLVIFRVDECKERMIEDKRPVRRLSPRSFPGPLHPCSSPQQMAMWWQDLEM